MSMVITDNSPSAGYVAWTGVIITFKEIPYSISNGNSNKKFIWWDFTNPNVLQESDTQPTLTDDDCIFILNRSGTHKLIPNATIYYSDLFADNPVGSMMDFAGATPPTGYLLCDGTAVSRTTYSALFAICGVLYGVGDGSTTFNLPNCKGKVSVGYNSAETEFDVLGETGGAKTPNTSTYVEDTGSYLQPAGSGYSYQHHHTVSALQPYITFNKIIKY
jgi:hypothetical protein